MTDELFIQGIDNTIAISRALIANGYKVLIQEFARKSQMDDVDWFDIITYSIQYEVIPAEDKF